MPGAANALKAGELPAHQKIIILDEIHKYGQWRNLVKGLYDTNKSKISFLVTGSARLDHYRKGGDSLQGRYHYWRMHPFSLIELNKNPTKKDFDTLLKFGGFPEPLLKGEEIFWRRWNKERMIRVIREDLRDLERVKEISMLEVLADTLPSKVGSPLSVKSLREDLNVDHKTAERWITILENLYVGFRIPPLGGAKIRAVKKEQKLYMWDWSQVEDQGHRFENMMACQLLKFCHLREDQLGNKMELRYLRDNDAREVDFVVLQNNKALFGVECKLSDKVDLRQINYFKQRTKVPEFYLVHAGMRDFMKDGVRVLPFSTFCKELKMP